jgi:hypothetical protein
LTTGLIVPLYTESSDAWERLLYVKKAHPSLPVVAIINPNSGPGRGPDETTYLSRVERLRSVGCSVLGYVATGYGHRDPAEARSDISKYKEWYKISGVFLDEMSRSRSDLSYYAKLCAFSRNLQIETIVGNPGLPAPSDYTETMDLVVMYENVGYPSLETLSNLTTVARRENRTSHDFLNIVSKYVGYVYVTERTLPNPFDRLPTKFEFLARILDSAD